MNYTLLIMAFLGLAIKVLVRYNSGLKLAIAANVVFNPKVFIQKDWLSVAIAVITILIAVLALPDITPILPQKYHAYINLLFVPIGYTGGDLLMRILNNSRKLTIKVIDAKTNELDYKEGEKEAGTKHEI